MKERVEDARWPKSVRMGNPALNAFSTLSGEREMLTLRLEDVTKLRVSDGTFSSGSAGSTIDTLKTGSQRADSFTAIVQ
jgi:hypothetical protein